MSGTGTPASSNSQNSVQLKYNYEILPEDFNNFDLNFKLIVIGDSGVGKSCLTTNGVKNIFDDSYNATVGFEFFNFNLKLNGKVINRI